MLRVLSSPSLLLAVAFPWQAGAEPPPDVLLQAMETEIGRSMELQLEDLEKPYFLQYTAQDVESVQISATLGAILDHARDHQRALTCAVRVGSPELDNTNFAGRFFSGGSRATGLPLEDDVLALRQAIWWTTDASYKDAVETLTRKRAYMEDKTLEDRPHDFSAAPAVQHLEEVPELQVDDEIWVERVRHASACFQEYAEVLESQADFQATCGTQWIVTSEGTRLRTAELLFQLRVRAQVQADDGMLLNDSRSYLARSPDGLPSKETVKADVEEMMQGLRALRSAPRLDSYIGPVLFDGMAATQVFQALLAGGLAGRVDPVGMPRSSSSAADNLERKLGRRILPDGFRVYDDPTVESAGGKPLLGHYLFDDEGVKARRVELVEDGILQDILLSRSPTKKRSGSNGHGRQDASGSVEAGIACLFVEAAGALPNEEMGAALREETEAQDLEFGIRVSELRALDAGLPPSVLRYLLSRSGSGHLNDPLYAYKVFPDGREELVRGLEFGEVTVRHLRDILTAGATPTVNNAASLGTAATLVAPPVLFEELELQRIEQELDKPPILPPPHLRG